MILIVMSCICKLFLMSLVRYLSRNTKFWIYLGFKTEICLSSFVTDYS